MPASSDPQPGSSESQSTAPFGIADIARFPAPGMAFPNTFAFSADDKLVTFLFSEGDNPIQQLYAFDVASGQKAILVQPPALDFREEALSPEEELRRQRERLQTVGITHYGQADKSPRILVPLAGDLYIQDGPNATLRKVVDNQGQAPALTPALSADGQYAAYVQDSEVYVVSAAGGPSRQLTFGARGTGKTHGLAEFMAQEEMDRMVGFWWSTDSRWLAFTEVDETAIPLYTIMHQGTDAIGPTIHESYRYPFAGQPNAIVKLGVVPVEGGNPIWMHTALGDVFAEYYIARVFWWNDGRLGAQILNRSQTDMALVAFNPADGTTVSVLHEHNDYWVTLRVELLTQLKDGRFIWASERSGFCQLYLYQADGTLIRQLTAGEWVVDTVHAVDESAGLVYFSGNREHPTEMHLYAVSLDGGEIRPLTRQPGTHRITMNHACSQYIDLFSALDMPPTVTIYSTADGQWRHQLFLPTDPRLTAFALRPPRLVTLANRNGDILHGAIFQPPARFGEGPFPTIVSVYGGPGPQVVRNDWRLTVALQNQYLANQGFLVFCLDNRGSARRGLAFEGALKFHMGTVEVEDQLDGVHWLITQQLADPDRVAVTGWSYGGYMTLRCLAMAPDLFKVGVAGAPTVAWDGYDTCYTERYMGTPESNSDGYRESSALAHVEAITGKLLLIHGLIDENVHFRHTARLINALTRARKRYDLVVFPEARHMPRFPADRIYLEERIISYFQDNLRQNH